MPVKLRILKGTTGKVPPLPLEERHPATNGCFSIAITSGKAGVGKSIVAANLACAINRRHKARVALLDLSLQFGDQGVQFDAEPEPSLVDVLRNVHDLTPEFLEACMHHACGISVLAAPPSPELADLFEPEHLNSIMEGLAGQYDAIVMDLSSHITDAWLEVVESADCVVAVTTPYLPSVKNTKLLLRTFVDLGIDPGRVSVALNRVEPSIKMPMETVEERLKYPIGTDLPHSPSQLVESVTEGVPVYVSKPKLEFSEKIGQMADALWALKRKPSALPGQAPVS